MQSTQKLYRPVGLKELILMLENKLTQFPPRLYWQPIFYPVLNFQYAFEIATKWNFDDENSGYSGFVTAFEIDKTYIERFEIQNVGGEHHNELWIPAEELENFNQNIQKPIQIEGCFYGEKYIGKINEKNAKEQFLYLQQKINEDTFEKIITENFGEILVNFAYWKQNNFEIETLQKIKNNWQNIFPSFKIFTEI